MAKRISNITQSGTKLIIEYNDCTIEEIDLCVECQEVPPEDNPGDWPDPIEGEDARCRVATHLGLFAAQRLDNFLSGLNLNISAVNIFEAYSAAKIAEYGWDINLWGALVEFCMSLYEGLSAGRGLAAKTQYDANTAIVVGEVQEALYCALSETGNFTQVEREFWRIGLYNRASEFYEVLGDFIFLVWPLSQLRELAFTASANTASVDCSSFGCAPGGDCDPECTPVNTNYPHNSANWTMSSQDYVTLGTGHTGFKAGAACELTLPAPMCILAVEVFYYIAASTGGWTKMRCSVDGVQFGLDNDVFSRTMCNDNTKSALFVDARVGQVIRFDGITTVGQGVGLMLCVNVKTCVP